MNWNSLFLGLGKGAAGAGDGGEQLDENKQKQKNVLAQQLMEQRRMKMQEDEFAANQRARQEDVAYRNAQALEKVYENPDIEGQAIDASSPLGQLIRARGGQIKQPTGTLPVDQNPLSVLQNAPTASADIALPPGVKAPLPNGVTTPLSPYPEFGQATPTPAERDPQAYAPQIRNLTTPAGAPLAVKPLSVKTQMEREQLQRFIQENKAWETLQGNLAAGMPEDKAWDTYYAARDPKDYAKQRHEDAVRGAEKKSDREWQMHVLTSQEERAARALEAATSRQNQTAARQIATRFGNDPTTKEFLKVAEGYKFVSSLDPKTQSPSDDMALIYAFAKAMDPASAVKEGEYNTVQKYAQSWASKFGFDVQRMVHSAPFLTEQARAQMKEAIRQSFAARKDTYNQFYNEVKTDISGFVPPEVADLYLRDYGAPFKNIGNTPVSAPGFNPTLPWTPEKQK